MTMSADPSRSGEGATAALAEFAATTRFADLPADVVHGAKRLILDCVGCAIGGASLDAGRIVVELAVEMGGGLGTATILGSGGRSASPSAAAFANCYLGNVLDADDTLLNSGHPGVLAVFGALAAGEPARISGKELITAVAVGYEIAARVGFSLQTTHIGDTTSAAPARTVTSGWLGFGVAVAAARVLGLDPNQMLHAVGIAGTTSPVGTGGSWPRTVAGKNMMKYVPYGFLGANGVLAAQLASKGMTATPAILEGDDGYWNIVGAAGCDWDLLAGRLGDSWYLPQTSFKPYASGRFSNLSVDLFRQLMRDHGLAPGEVTAVEVLTFPRAAEDWFSGNRDPQTQIDMQFSIPLAIAAAAHGSDLGPRWMSARQMHDPDMRAFASKVRVGPHPDSIPAITAQIAAEGRFRRVPTRVSIQARDATFTADGDSAWGDPWDEQSRMTDQQLADKFRTFTDQNLRSDRAESVIDVAFDLDNVEDICSTLVPALR
ncbi:MAG TPA: MmgE/PrpD family protein [Mycobacteriales bacterium]|jgi:2-methylcitrate dehydratase PrpD|nr:MmgE/PrpD family protein [Mycobacteriales bacterium]